MGLVLSLLTIPVNMDSLPCKQAPTRKTPWTALDAGPRVDDTSTLEEAKNPYTEAVQIFSFFFTLPLFRLQRSARLSEADSQENKRCENGAPILIGCATSICQYEQLSSGGQVRALETAIALCNRTVPSRSQSQSIRTWFRPQGKHNRSHALVYIRACRLLPVDLSRP